MSEKESTKNLGSRRQARRRKRLIVAGVVGVVMLVLAILVAKPIYRSFKQMRAESLSEQARVAMESEEWREAFRLASESYTLSPDSPDVLRLMAELTGMNRAQLDKALYFLRRLRELGVETLVDRQLEVKVLTGLGDLDAAERKGRALLEEAPNDAKGYDLMATVMSARGDLNEAVAFLEKSLELDPDNLENRLKYAAALAESSFDEVRARGWGKMWEIAQDTGDMGLRALEYIGVKEQVPVGKEREYIDLLEGHPDSGESHRLLALKWKITIDPLKRAELLAEAIEERKGRPMTELVEFLDWLNRIGEPQPLLDVLTLENAKVNPTLFSLYLNALGKLQRWEDVEAALRADGVPLSQGQVHFTRSNAMRQQGIDDDSLRDEVAKAVQYAVVEKNEELSFQAAVLAEQLGYRDDAMTGFAYAANEKALANTAYERMFELARRASDTDQMSELFAEIEEKNIAAPELLLEGTYLNLLVGNQVEVFRRRAESLVEARPGEATRWLVLALGHYRMMDKSSCAEACAKVDTGELGPGKRAVMAAMLEWTGDSAGAFELAQSVPASLLLDEERALLARGQ